MDTRLVQKKLEIYGHFGIQVNFYFDIIGSKLKNGIEIRDLSLSFSH